MAVSSYKVFLYNNGRQVTESKTLEMLLTSVSVSADGGLTNTLTIKEGESALANTFDFGGKQISNVLCGTESGQVLTYEKIGANNGIASLDSGGKVPVAQLPNSIMEYKGVFNPTTHVPNLNDDAKASLTLADITFRAVTAGLEGSDITIEYTDTATAGSEVANLTSDTTIVVEIESGVSTATQIVTAVTNSGPVSAKVVASVTGTGSNAQSTTAATNLAGGANAGTVFKASTGGSHNAGSGAITYVTGDYAIYNGTIWEKAHAGADAVLSVDGQTGIVDLSGVYDALGAATGILATSISDGDTTHAPTGNAVFDALAGKSDTSHNHTGVYDPAGTAAALLTSSITDGDTTHAPTGNAVYDALALKANAADVGSDKYAAFTNKETGSITVRQFVKMLTVGQVTLLTSTDSVNEETFFGCVKDATIAADAPGNVYFPEVGAVIPDFTALDVTKLVYAHATTPGSYTQTRPTTGKVIILGKPVSATSMIFLGRMDYVYA